MVLPRTGLETPKAAADRQPRNTHAVSPLVDLEVDNPALDGETGKPRIASLLYFFDTAAEPIHNELGTGIEYPYHPPQFQ